MLTPEEQLHIIKSGTAQIVPESALLEKLKRGVAGRTQRKDCGSLQFHFHHRIYFARNGWIYPGVE